jgi:polysaccharide chain length determinant protein (PEP-CTERM system associated)
LEQTQLTIKETEQKISTLSDQIESRKTNKDNSSVRSFEGPSSLTTRYDSRIKTIEENLDQLILQYTELHPDVVEANNLLVSLIASRNLEIDEYLSTDNDKKPEQIGSFTSELELEMSRLKSQVASLQVRESSHSSKIEVLKQKIDLVPQVEAERTALNRDYEVTQRKYSELLARKEQAELAQKADVSSESVQFRVIDPPIAPNSASGPNRLINYTIVLILGFAAGLGLAFLISQLNPVLIRSSQLTTLTLFPILGTVSHLNKLHIKRVKRSRLLVFLFSSSLITGVYAVLIAAEIMNIDIYARVFSLIL